MGFYTQGVSVVGHQECGSGAVGPDGLVSIRIDSPLPRPWLRLGYINIEARGSGQTERGEVIRSVLFNGTALRFYMTAAEMKYASDVGVVAYWNIPGLNWTAQNA